jgi:opacity protein-like surface antigen
MRSKLKQLLFAAALIAVAAPAIAADVAMSVSIGQPGFYGQIDIGGYPPPRVLYRQPIMVEQVEMVRSPIYLRVPPGHAKNWRKHCGEYNACGERVYFVQNNWYNREYVPRYQERRYEYPDEHRGNDRNDHPGNSQGKGKKR